MGIQITIFLILFILKLKQNSFDTISFLDQCPFYFFFYTDKAWQYMDQLWKKVCLLFYDYYYMECTWSGKMSVYMCLYLVLLITWNSIICYKLPSECVQNDKRFHNPKLWGKLLSGRRITSVQFSKCRESQIRKFTWKY